MSISLNMPGERLLPSRNLSNPRYIRIFMRSRPRDSPLPFHQFQVQQPLTFTLPLLSPAALLERIENDPNFLPPLSRLPEPLDYPPLPGTTLTQPLQGETRHLHSPLQQQASVHVPLDYPLMNAPFAPPVAINVLPDTVLDSALIVQPHQADHREPWTPMSVRGLPGGDINLPMNVLGQLDAQGTNTGQRGGERDSTSKDGEDREGNQGEDEINPSSSGNRSQGRNQDGYEGDIEDTTLGPKRIPKRGIIALRNREKEAEKEPKPQEDPIWQDWEKVVDIYMDGTERTGDVGYKDLTEQGKRVVGYPERYRQILETVGRARMELGPERFIATVGYEFSDNSRKKRAISDVVTRCQCVLRMVTKMTHFPESFVESSNLIDAEIRKRRRNRVRAKVVASSYSSSP